MPTLRSPIRTGALVGAAIAALPAAYVTVWFVRGVPAPYRLLVVLACAIGAALALLVGAALGALVGVVVEEIVLERRSPLAMFRRGRP